MNYDETITTLQFASRAIKIKVDPKINEKVEMRKLKEQVIDFKNLKNIDSIIQENKKIEKDAHDLKNSYNNYKNELKNKSKSDYEDNKQSDIDSSNMIKKFQMMILHLQNELSKSVFIIKKDCNYIQPQR